MDWLDYFVLFSMLMVFVGVIAIIAQTINKRIDDLKADNKALRDEFKADNKALRDEFKADNKALRDEFKELRDDLKADNKELRDDLKADNKEIRNQVYNHIPTQLRRIENESRERDAKISKNLQEIRDLLKDRLPK